MFSRGLVGALFITHRMRCFRLMGFHVNQQVHPFLDLAFFFMSFLVVEHRWRFLVDLVLSTRSVDLRLLSSLSKSLRGGSRGRPSGIWWLENRWFAIPHFPQIIFSWEHGGIATQPQLLVVSNQEVSVSEMPFSPCGEWGGSPFNTIQSREIPSPNPTFALSIWVWWWNQVDLKGFPKKLNTITVYFKGSKLLFPSSICLRLCFRFPVGFQRNRLHYWTHSRKYRSCPTIVQL